MLRTPQDILDELNKPSISYEKLREARARVSVMLANVQNDPEADRTHKIAINGIFRILDDLVEGYWVVSRDRIHELIDNLKNRIEMLIELVQKLSPKTQYRLRLKLQEMRIPPIRPDPQLLPDFPDLSSLRLPPHTVPQEYSKGPTRAHVGPFGQDPFLNTDRQPHISISRPSSTTSSNAGPPDDRPEDLTQVNNHEVESQSNLANISSIQPFQQSTSRRFDDRSNTSLGAGERAHRPPRPLVTVTRRAGSSAESRILPNPSRLTDYDLRAQTPPEGFSLDHHQHSVAGPHDRQYHPQPIHRNQHAPPSRNIQDDHPQERTGCMIASANRRNQSNRRMQGPIVESHPDIVSDYTLPPEPSESRGHTTPPIHEHRNDRVETQLMTRRENVSGPRRLAFSGAQRNAFTPRQTGARRSESIDGWDTGSQGGWDDDIQNLPSLPGPSDLQHSHDPLLYPTHNVHAGDSNDDDDDDIYCSE